MSGIDKDVDDGFLNRWSRRKRAPAAQPVDPDIARESDADVAPATEDEALSDEDLAALPRVADLAEGSDIRGFLRPGVPQALKNAAMRRMWMLTPAIRDHVDPAVDYAWDWNTPGGVPGDGFGPTPERAAQMLQDLLAPRQPEAAAQPDPVSDPVGTPDPDNGIPTDQPPPPVEEPRASEISLKPDAGTPPEIVGRRHGGALPG